MKPPNAAIYAGILCHSARTASLARFLQYRYVDALRGDGSPERTPGMGSNHNMGSNLSRLVVSVTRSAAPIRIGASRPRSAPAADRCNRPYLRITCAHGCLAHHGTGPGGQEFVAVC